MTTGSYGPKIFELEIRSERKPYKTRKTRITASGWGVFKDFHRWLWNHLEKIENLERRRRGWKGEPSLDVKEETERFIDLDNGHISISSSSADPEGRMFEVEHDESVDIQRLVLQILFSYLKEKHGKIPEYEGVEIRNDVRAVRVYRNLRTGGYNVEVEAYGTHPPTPLDDDVRREGNIKVLDSGYKRTYIVPPLEEHKLTEIIAKLLLKKKVIIG